MPARAVVLPATPLLVPGAAGTARPLGDLRAAVADALAAVRTPHGAVPQRWGVLAPGPRTAAGARRASLAAAGVHDRWLPGPPTGVTLPAAHVPASVALLVLARALGDDVAAGAHVVEVADDDPGAVRVGLRELAGVDALVVAGGSPADPAAGPTACTTAVAGVLAGLADRGGWSATTRTVAASGDHLPGAYDVVTWAD
ncbi:hypothetical protein [Isoptericola sp. AK164]|uniref:hypothetical protein n=1 Tax=Isoptericola sp. AK164 TaxID=3024246 RepID=UPI002418AB72|nr:hypothetical protein [Isoptericola sp. AK164]